MSKQPTILSIKSTNEIGGRVAHMATVQWPGEEPEVVGFIGSIYGGPVVMVTETFGQVFVTDPGRFGDFSVEWVRRFYA